MTKSTKPTSQSFERLTEATTTDEILSALAVCCQESAGNNDSGTLVPTLAEICAFLPDDAPRYTTFDFSETVSLFGTEPNHYLAQAWHIFFEAVMLHRDHRPSIQWDRETKAQYYQPVTLLLEENPQKAQLRSEAQYIHLGLMHRNSNSDITIIHNLWKEARDFDTSLKHPLAPIVKEWLNEQAVKPITTEHDKLHPVAIIKNPMGSVREINFTDPGNARLREFATPERISQASPDQMRLGFDNEPPSILPDIMPLEVPPPEGVKPSTKGGAVSHVVRIFYESIMALEPHERASDIAFRLGDLIDYLNPDGKFHRTNQLPYIIDALDILHIHATLPWIDDTGEMRKWRPVWVKSPLSMDSKNDAPVHMRVEVPPDARQGYMILKHTHRLLGKKSGPQFNAYHTISWLWDKHATVQGKLIDPTRPIDRRNEKGEIVDKDGKPILTARGKPITNLYDDKVIAQGEREDNPAADRYPVLSKNDLIAACMPKAIDTNPRRLWEKAKKYWEDMEAQGIIRIKRERTGWRIFPSQEHLAAHRGVRKSAQKKV